MKRKRKRANGEGTIFKLPNGRWKGVLSVATTGGRRRRLSRTARNQADVLALLAKLRTDLGQGAYVEPSRKTVGNILDDWLIAVSAKSAPATVELYRSMIDRILKQRPCEADGIPLGAMPAQKLRLATVQRFVDFMSIEDKERAIKKVPTRTQQITLSVLRKAMRYAAKREEIAGDPTAGVDRPAHERKDISPFELGEAESLLAHFRKTRWHALVTLAITCGLRIGELLGLKWDAINLSDKTLFVTQQAAELKGQVTVKKPKTKASVRMVELTSLAVQALESHRDILKAEGLEDSEMVFPAPEGGIMSRTNFRNRVWNPSLSLLGLKHRGIHHTRHTYATLALKAGVPVHVVAKVMGHAKPSTTHDTYAHVLRGQQEQATSAMARLFQ